MNKTKLVARTAAPTVIRLYDKNHFREKGFSLMRKADMMFFFM